MKLLNAVWAKAQDHKRILVVAGVLFTLLLALTFYYLRKSSQTKTYYIAYVGRYTRPNFDKLHELALGRYLDELNAELRGVQLKLKTFNNNGNAKESQQIYENISADGGFIAVIDNTWGRELQPVASLIREKKIPIIAINADKQGTDFQRHVMFMGHGDDVPHDIVGFSQNILKTRETIFITEESYPLTKQFIKEFEGVGVKVMRLGVSSDAVVADERDRLFQSLDTKFNETRQRQQEPPTVVLNTHAYWGVEIINYIDTKHKGVTILGGPSIVNWSNAGQFGQNGNGNSVIMLTTPSDAVLNKVYLDLKKIREGDPDVSAIVNAQLFVKRCLDAVSIIRGVFYEESAQSPRTAVSRSDFVSFFQEKLVAKEHIGKHDLYEFDDNLFLLNEKAFEKHFGGEVFSYPKQLNSHAEVIPNVYFGLEIINISNINTENRAFHADFFYWLKFNKEYEEIEKWIHFRNEKNASSKPQALITNENPADQTVYKLFKMSADFSMNVDFEKYPLDTQELKIEVELINPADSLRISFDHASFEHSKKKAEEFSLDEWYTKDFYITVDNFVGNSLLGGTTLENKTPRRFKTLNVRMPIQRRWASPFVTIILPLVMMGFTAIALLYVENSTFSNIGEVCVGIFLSIVTYSIAFAEITPRSNVLTIADILFYGTFFTIFLVFLKVIILNSSMMSESARRWTNARANVIGFTTLIGYCLMIAVILFSGLI